MTEGWVRQLRAFFDTRVEDWSSYGDEFAINGYKAPGQSPYWTNQIRQRLLEDVVEKLELSPEHHVLDVGCGTGMMLRQIAPRVAQITGVDFSERMVELAERHLPGNAIVQRENAESLPFKNEAFNRVLCYNVILNFPDDNFTFGVLTELVRITRKRGLILVGYVPDYDKREEQALFVNQLQQKAAESRQHSFTSRIIARAKDLWLYRLCNSVKPNLWNRFYTRGFFENFARQNACDIKILPMNVEGYIYAPYRYDVRLWPRGLG